MRGEFKIAVVIPAYNEEAAIGKVISAIPRWVDDVVVVDNGSQDGTRQVVQEHGARVVVQPQRGYGAACLAGIAALESPDVVVFLDGDYSDYPEEMKYLVDPIVSRKAEFVIGSRIRGIRQPGALTLQSRIGNWIACKLIRLFWGARFTDLGPFRTIRFSALKEMDMRDKNFGWTVEMQIKAIQLEIRTLEVPVRYRKRIGESKISGTLKGVVLAGGKILITILFAAVKGKWKVQKNPVLSVEDNYIKQKRTSF